jgi:hypothetical protein
MRELHHLCRRLLQIARPIVHQRHTLGEQIAAPVGGLDGIADRVRQGLFHHVVGMAGGFGGPIAECRAEADAIQWLDQRLIVYGPFQ